MESKCLTKEQIYRRKYYEANKESILAHKRETYKQDPEKVLAHKRETYKQNKDRIYEHNLEYLRSDKGKEIRRIANHKRRGLGVNPLNSYRKGLHFHHMYLNGDSSIGIYIPSTLHRSVYHSGSSLQGIKEMNKQALLWLCAQSEI